MNPDQTRSFESTQRLMEEKPLTYAEFSRLLAHYKRAVYESIHKAPNPIEELLKLK